MRLGPHSVLSDEPDLVTVRGTRLRVDADAVVLAQAPRRCLPARGTVGCRIWNGRSGSRWILTRRCRSRRPAWEQRLAARGGPQGRGNQVLRAGVGAAGAHPGPARRAQLARRRSPTTRPAGSMRRHVNGGEVAGSSSCWTPASSAKTTFPAPWRLSPLCPQRRSVTAPDRLLGRVGGPACQRSVVRVPARPRRCAGARARDRGGPRAVEARGDGLRWRLPRQRLPPGSQRRRRAQALHRRALRRQGV